MFKKMVLRLTVMGAVLMGSINFTYAQVEVNKADQAALESIKGIGPSTSMKILDARKKDGPFKAWPDFADRVKGIGEKTAVKLSDAGLTVNGHSLPNAGVVPPFATKNNEANIKEDSRSVNAGTAVKVPAAVTGVPLAKTMKDSTRLVTQSPPLFPSTSSLPNRSSASTSAH